MDSNTNNNNNSQSNNPNGFFNFDFPFQILDDGRDLSSGGNPFDASTIPSDLLQFMNDDQMFSAVQNPTDLLPALPPTLPATASATPVTDASATSTAADIPDESSRKRRRDNEGMDAASRLSEAGQAEMQGHVERPSQTQVQDTSEQEPLNQTMMVIVVGGRAFRLSWESLKSDGPNNFFTDFLRRTQTRLMHVDRDADTFAVIVHHLRGYSVQPRTQMEYHNLLNDAIYYNLRRLRQLLQEYVFLNVGGREFRLPWSLLKKGKCRLSFMEHSLFEKKKKKKKRRQGVGVCD